MGETEFDMTVRTNFVSSIGRLLTRLNGKTQVEYVFEGKVMLDIGHGEQDSVPGKRHGGSRDASQGEPSDASTVRPLVQLFVLAALRAHEKSCAMPLRIICCQASRSLNRSSAV